MQGILQLIRHFILACLYRLVSLAAKALFFVLIQRTKDQVSKEASFPHGPLPCKSGKTGAGIYCG